MVCVRCVMHTTGKRKQPQPKMVTDEEIEKPTTKKKKSEGLCVHTYDTHVYTTFLPSLIRMHARNTSLNAPKVLHANFIDIIVGLCLLCL